MGANGVHSRAMLVALRISTWTARKLDKRVTARVNAQHGASQDAGRYNKNLLGDAEEYRDLMRVAQKARDEHYKNTLEWPDEGWRLLPTSNFMPYTERLRELRREFETALETFLAVYPSLVERARVRLNGMFRPEDYPPVHALRNKFRFETEFGPVPAGSDLRIALPQEQLDQLVASVEARAHNATKRAVQSAWRRLHECVEHIHERLADPKNIFRDTLIGNARELVDVLARLNVTEDPDLERMRREVEERLTSYDPQALRDQPELRSQVAREAEEIMSRMAGLYGGGK